MSVVRDILATIVERKREEVRERKARQPSLENRIEEHSLSKPRGFRAALLRAHARGQPAIIAEIKKASPSKGLIRPDFDPVAIARQYEQGGAACLSVLTDVDFFQGADEYLVQTRAATELPVLRKDFIIDSYQIVESRWLGADCVLLIAACLHKDLMVELYERASSLGMDVLVEVHDEAELHTALALGCKMVGINNRNLRTFETSLETTLTLASMIPEGTLIVTESGIHTASDIQMMRNRGIHTFLIGEALMRCKNPGEGLRELLKV